MEIKRQFPRNHQQQVKEYVDYLMEHCPFASWRRVVIALDRMGGEKEVVDSIRHLTESLIGVLCTCIIVIFYQILS